MVKAEKWDIGYFSPEDFTYLGGKDRRYQLKGSGITVSRRQFEQEFKLKPKGFSTFEQKGKAREILGIPKGPGKGHKARPVVKAEKVKGWYIAYLTGQQDVLLYIQTQIPRNYRVMVKALGKTKDPKYINPKNPQKGHTQQKPLPEGEAWVTILPATNQADAARFWRDDILDEEEYFLEEELDEEGEPITATRPAARQYAVFFQPIPKGQ